MTLAVLRCDTCGAAAPLRAAASVRCLHCRNPIAIPARWQAAAEAHAAEEAVRRDVEPRWQTLSTAVGGWAEAVAKLALFVLPPLLTWLAQATLSPPPSPAENLGFVAFPALLPGSLLWLWATTVNATVLRLHLALRARQDDPEGPLACRSCGAPLAVEPGAVATTCLYCGTDSLVTGLPPARDSLAARDLALRTLAEAATMLRRRRINLALGMTLLGCGVTAVAAATSLVLSLTFGT